MNHSLANLPVPTNGLKPFEIIFRESAVVRSDVHHWVRYSPSLEAARADAKRTVEAEYPMGQLLDVREGIGLYVRENGRWVPVCFDPECLAFYDLSEARIFTSADQEDAYAHCGSCSEPLDPAATAA